MDLNDFKEQHFDNLSSPSNGLLNVSTNACVNSGVNGKDIFPVTQQFVSTNSFDLNIAASLSDDSGVPLTNSSILSVDSCRVGLYKLELELAESDYEVSQIDSLEDFSDCGMSGEHFSTLKKGPLAPIDPPPEFQDSPHTTMLRCGILQNYAVNLSEYVIVTALNKWLSSKVNCKNSQKDFSLSSLPFDFDIEEKNVIKNDININHNNDIHSSDSLLNRCYNLYDKAKSNLSSSNEQNLKAVVTNSQREFNIFNKSYSQNLKQTSALTKPITHTFTFSQNQDDKSEIYDYNFYYASKNCQKNNCYQSQRKTPSLLYNPLHHLHSGSNIPSLKRPNSRNSLNSRLSSSHNSLIVPNSNKADDSIFITQAMSHDALLSQEICDFYNVPIGADIYSFPIDMIRPSLLPSLSQKAKDFSKHDNEKVSLQKERFKNTRNNKKRRRYNNTINEAAGMDKIRTSSKTSYKRHSVPENAITPLHMTLDEVKKFYHSLYSSRSDSSEILPQINNNNYNNKKKDSGHTKLSVNNEQTNFVENSSSVTFVSTISASNIKNATKPINSKFLPIDKSKQNRLCIKNENVHNFPNITTANKYLTPTNNDQSHEKKSQFFINLNLKQKFCNIFRIRKSSGNRRTNSSIFDPSDYISNRTNNRSSNLTVAREDINKFSSRALPPLPNKNSVQKSCNIKDEKKSEFNSTIHFASNIEKVKDYGWYWGPISSEAAEKILSNEPDGSFIVRDSSDDHYIFSLSFKLNNYVRHVRIEQDQGTFSFGSYAKFKSQTITEFIEKAVEHSRSGRYLFFLHRRPEHGPMRVQLTNPVSRFKHIQSLQHMCRFVILKAVVRKDLILNLPLPRRLLDYLSYKHCYSEQVECDSNSQS